MCNFLPEIHRARGFAKMSGNKEFDEQLRMQQLYGQKKGEDGEDPYTYTDPEDGTMYDWDQDKKAWFPKITEDFLAAYHANYGFNEDGEQDQSASAAPKADPPAKPGDAPKPPAAGANTTPSGDESKSKEAKQKGEKRKADPGWFDVDQVKNTNVYVSGLPLDITPDEFVEVMSKCGIVMRDPITEEYKVKLYKDDKGNLKGDGLCCYLKRESVALAERLLDESEIRGYQLHVEAARFELKGQYDSSKKKKKSKEYRKKMQQQQKQLDWRPEKKGDVRKRHERVLIIQNMFHPSDFEEDPLVLNEIRDDLRTECEKFGQVKKVIIFDRHPDGVASVAFKEPEDADVCQLALEGRWFGGRKLSAQLWDGVTDYQVEETNREREERLKGWSNFLDGGKGKGKAGDDPANTESTEGADKGPVQGDPRTSTEEPPSQQEEPAAERPKPGSVEGGEAVESSQGSGEGEEAVESQGNGAGTSEGTEVDSTDSSLAASDEEEEGSSRAHSVSVMEEKLDGPEASGRPEEQSRSILFTYFQGDINSVVDEHFSRALNKSNKPKDLSTKNKSSRRGPKEPAPAQWVFPAPAPWPEPTFPSSSSGRISLSAAEDQRSPQGVITSPGSQPSTLWSFAPRPGTSFGLPTMVYPQPVSAEGPGVSERPYASSFLNLLHSDRPVGGAAMGSPSKPELAPSWSPSTGFREPLGPGISLDGIQVPEKKKDLYWY
ncbi:hypothetical protein AAFF_G00018280 [Aldrovandia affinis]|uniref:17S U2 SnRNP complex component HTATSF1 n=1 Tax=Aldrovandia affinis TaxID=143900 RepID=A0AAD7WGV4_9TELE|nr:hypothetical protein AAFF_G00018280 [Aldrovandia affinis]